MAYKYKEERPGILTDTGQREFLKVRDRAKVLLKAGGAFMLFSATKDILGGTWKQMAYVDRLVELGEIKEITTGDVAGQDRVFVAATS